MSTRSNICTREVREEVVKQKNDLLQLSYKNNKMNFLFISLCFHRNYREGDMKACCNTKFQEKDNGKGIKQQFL